MKKTFILITLILFSTFGYACVCSISPINQKFVQSDFVAEVTVTKIHKNKNNDQYYRADIHIEDLFKGEKLKSIYIDGNNGRNFETSCDIFINEGEKIIVYATKNKEDKYTIGMCSGLVYLNKSKYSEITKKRHQKELDVLDLLKSENVKFTNTVRFKTGEDSGVFLRTYKGIELNKKIAIYEVTFKKDLEVKCVRRISGFGHKIDRKIKRYLKNNDWSSVYEDKLNQVPKNTKHLVIIYYYKHKNIGYLSESFYVN